MLLPRLSTAQPPDPQFLLDVHELIARKTHPSRILLPPAVVGPDELRAVRQTDLRKRRAAPTTVGTGGTVAAGVYTVAATYATPNGETVALTPGTVTTTGTTTTITVPSPPVLAGATGWYAYVSQVNGTTLTRQQTAGLPTAIRTALALTAPPTSTGLVFSHEIPSVVAVPADVLANLARKGVRDHGPGALHQKGAAVYWVGIAVRIAHDGKRGALARVYIADDVAYMTEREFRRRVRDIQTRLAAAGVLPWAAFDGARVPTNWWARPEFTRAIAQWFVEGDSIDAMQRYIYGIVAGLATFERTNSREQAEATLLANLHRAA